MRLRHYDEVVAAYLRQLKHYMRVCNDFMAEEILLAMKEYQEFMESDLVPA